MPENEVKTISISIDEYFDLRQKAEMNILLTNELSEIKTRFNLLEVRMYELEQKVKGGVQG